MTGWLVGERVVCAALMAAAGLVFLLRPGARSARVIWIVLWGAGLAHALALNLQESNLLGTNVAHYYLGAKYPIGYTDFYRVIQAALGLPQVGIRDLEHPGTLLRQDPRARRAYYIDLMRDRGEVFDPLAPLDSLAARARASGAVAAESARLLSAHLPPRRIEAFRDDVRRAVSAQPLRPLTEDYGFNGSPFYALVRQADPTLHVPFGRGAAALNLAWQILASVVLAWIVGRALALAAHEWLAIGALLFASWDFAAFALPGLIFGELWIPVALAALAMRRRRAAAAGVAVAWAGLVKLFPFVLALPAIVRLAPGATRDARIEGDGVAGAARPWSLRFLASVVAATLVLGLAGLLSGRSWIDFAHKIAVEFQAGFSMVNSVSRSALLQTLGIHASLLNPALAVVAMAFLAAMFAGDRDDAFREALPRRALVLVGALGWVVHSWLNYYAIVPFLLLPWYARRHRAGVAIATLAMAGSLVLPDFGNPALVSRPALHFLKLLPYLLVPAWLVTLELRAMTWSPRLRRAAAVVAALCVVATAGEAWRMRTIRRLDARGQEALNAGDAAAALRSFRGVTRLAPGDGRARMYEAIALASSGRMREARGAFERAVARAPDYAAARDNYGRALLMEGRIDEAAHHLEKARALAPYDVEIHVVLARIRMGQGQKREAIALLRRALELDPADDKVAELLRQVAGE